MLNIFFHSAYAERCTQADAISASTRSTCSLVVPATFASPMRGFSSQRHTRSWPSTVRVCRPSRSNDGTTFEAQSCE